MSGLAATAAAGWLYDSQAFSARVLRGALSDLQSDPGAVTVPDFSGWTEHSVDFCWIGHVTVLINFYGFKILTDPVLFDRVGLQTPFGTLGRKRVVAPPLHAKDLSDIDLILLSHAHMDHLDIPSLQALPKSVPVITAPKTEDLSRAIGFNDVTELRWGQSTTVHRRGGSLAVEAFEVRHWGARFKRDTFRGYNGFLLNRGRKTILFAGDTEMCDTFAPLKCRNISAAIMPIGSYGRGGTSHCTPEEAVTMTDRCGADFILPVHHSTLPIGKEPFFEPVERLRNAVSAERIAFTSVGATWKLPA